MAIVNVLSKLSLATAEAAVMALGVAGSAQAATLFQSSYTADTIFQDQLNSTTMTLAYDGNNYWSSSGGSNLGIRYAQYNNGSSVLVMPNY
ncbi:hypothetical protein [Nostoc sp. LEGE 12450]|uniref:hypothetical protein n=1 Tax=Nostoc sp. LEGE 12450 TaxID=1828643 RepID=UPI00187EEF87|nr:hypothetical protein [Nostoc sp. LEGE 12450]MBE8992370.1 hypothetical protein [Nostoc sp. LEGE 12450]